MYFFPHRPGWAKTDYYVVVSTSDVSRSVHIASEECFWPEEIDKAWEHARQLAGPDSQFVTLKSGRQAWLSRQENE